MHDRVKLIEEKIFNKSTCCDSKPGDKVLNQFFSSTQNPLSKALHQNQINKGYSPNDVLAKKAINSRKFNRSQSISPIFGTPIQRSHSALEI